MATGDANPLKELEPEDKPESGMPSGEYIIEFYLEAFRAYIEKHLDYKDLLFYKYFDRYKQKHFLNIAEKSRDEVVGKMLDEIAKREELDRYGALVNVLEETENEKVLRIIKGRSFPDVNYKDKIRPHMTDLVHGIEVVQIVPLLLEHKIILPRELTALINKTDPFEASIDLVLMLPNRNPNWYPAFLACLCKANLRHLAMKIDQHVTQELEKDMKLTESNGREWTVESFQKGRENLSSLIDNSLFGTPHQQAGVRQLKHVQRSEHCEQTEPKMKLLTFGAGPTTNNIAGQQQQASTEPQMHHLSFESGEPSANNLSPFKEDVDGKRSLVSNQLSTATSQASRDLTFSFLANDRENVSGNSSGSPDWSHSSDFKPEDQFDEIFSTENSDVTTPVTNVVNQGSNDETELKAAFHTRSLREKDSGSRSEMATNKLPPLRDHSVEKQMKDKDIVFDVDKPTGIVTEQRNITGVSMSLDAPSMEEEVEELIPLRDYQTELAAPAIAGQNVIIVAPTGSGKTRVALRIIQEHMRAMAGHGISKVIFLVNQVALAHQQGEQCRSHLKKQSCHIITGESQRSKSEYLKDFIDKRDILVVTAQVLLDALVRKEIASINSFSLIIFDECHHTHANHTFNQIMGLYMQMKLNQKDVDLPQVVGLTASVGVGKARNEEKAVEHIKRLMANLDAHVISTVENNMAELREYVSLPDEEIHSVPRRADDQFGRTILKLMTSLENRMSSSSLVKEMTDAVKFEAALKPPAQKGNAQYTQWVNKLWKEMAKLKNAEARKFLHPIRVHLEYYNNALMIYNDARLEDAKEYLAKEMAAWKECSTMDSNEDIIYKAYLRVREYKFSQCNNPKLEKLREMIVHAYRDVNADSRGIVFVKTRDLAHALVRWMKDTPGLRELNPIPFLGQNMSAGGMTKVEQDDALKYFREGRHKLIVATSVAEEGLDISKCNLVIRYDHVTNEIAMVQSRGRARAADSKYYMIAEEKTGMVEKEELNVIREVMMRKAIIQLQKYIKSSAKAFEKEVSELQKESNLDRQLKSLGKNRKLIRAGQFELHCLRCDDLICFSDSIKKIQNAHHVIVDDTLEERVRFVEGESTRYADESIQIKGKVICRSCGDSLGVLCIHRNLEFPVAKIEKFLIVDKNGRQITCKKWKSVPFTVNPLSTEDFREIYLSRQQQM